MTVLSSETFIYSLLLLRWGEYKQTVRAGFHIKTHWNQYCFFSFSDQFYILDCLYLYYSLYPLDILLFVCVANNIIMLVPIETFCVSQFNCDIILCLSICYSVKSSNITLFYVDILQNTLSLGLSICYRYFFWQSSYEKLCHHITLA